jgi:trans-aconitate 2-methyltransferase
MPEWDATQYLKFGSERMRPAVDLIGRISRQAPKTIVDLGCGAGNVTRILAERWPNAEVIGVDSSSQMLEKAKSGASAAIRWIEADFAEWRPEKPVDLVFSNAALHWYGDHETLFPALLSYVSHDGVLAIQMPRNHSAPALTAIYDIARDGPWVDRLEPLLRTSPVASPDSYYSIFSSYEAQIDIWETIYYQVLSGPDPVVEFSKGTVLRPLIAALNEVEAGQFLDRYAARMKDAYPPGGDGNTIYPFRRLFLMVSPVR